MADSSCTDWSNLRSIVPIYEVYRYLAYEHEHQLNKWRYVHFFLEEQLFLVNIYQYEKFITAIAW